MIHSMYLYSIIIIIVDIELKGYEWNAISGNNLALWLGFVQSLRLNEIANTIINTNLIIDSLQANQLTLVLQTKSAFGAQPSLSGWRQWLFNYINVL